MINPTLVTLPLISEDCKTVKVAKLLIDKGDYIEQGTPLIEVATDKALLEIPSNSKGKVLKLWVQEGDTLSVGDPLCLLSAESLSNIQHSINRLSEEFEALEELQDFYYRLTELLDISHDSSPEEIFDLIKNKIK